MPKKTHRFIVTTAAPYSLKKTRAQINFAIRFLLPPECKCSVRTEADDERNARRRSASRRALLERVIKACRIAQYQ